MKLGWHAGRPRPWPQCVRWGPRSPSPKGTQPPILGPYLLWPNSSMDQDATWCGGRPRPKRHFIRCGPSSLSKNGTEPSIFGPCLLWSNNCMGQDATWYEGRSRPRLHCVTWGPSSLLPSFGPCLLWPNGRPSQLLQSTYYTMLARLVVSYFILLRCNPMKLMAKDICERWLGLCRYAEYRHVASLVICLVTGALYLQAGQSLKCDPARPRPWSVEPGRAARQHFRLDCATQGSPHMYQATMSRSLRDLSCIIRKYYHVNSICTWYYE